MQITDRAKDLIKSGGEWISSVELENLAADHPEIEMAAVIAMPSAKWGERPLLVVKKKDDCDLNADEINYFLAGKVAKWWLPDKVTFVDSIPLTAAGKINKVKLRAQFRADPSVTLRVD
jgi:fatty-acyl-CoA synthase